MNISIVIAYVSCLVVFLAIDMVWLQGMNGVLYQPTIGALLAEKPNIAAIAVFYLIYIAGVMVFAVQPALQSASWSDALVRGALLGFFCYATYDLTNMATLKVWSLTLTLADLAWGTVLTGTAATASFFITRMFVR